MDENIKIPKEFEELKKSSPFQVPDGYFESFSSKLMDKINEPEKETRYIRFLNIARSQFALATSLAALFIIAFFVTKLILNEPNQINLTTEEIVLTLENEAHSLDENEIFAMLESDENQYVDEKYQLTEEDILQYLDYEGDNIDILIDDF